VDPGFEFRTNAPGWINGISDANMPGQGLPACAQTDEVNVAYFEHHRERAWDRLNAIVTKTMIACCDFEMDAEYVRTLKSAGIHPVRLGAGFAEFARSQAETHEAAEVLAI
jgi:hypothetical protein